MRPCYKEQVRLFCVILSFLSSPVMPTAFKRNRKGHTAREVEDTASPTDTLVPVEALPKVRKPYGFQDAITGPHGLVYAPSGVYSHQGEPSTGHGLDNTTKDFEAITLEAGTFVMKDTAGGTGAEDQAKKKQRQWQKWSKDIIPALLKPYLDILHQTSGLRNMDVIRKGIECKGCSKGRLLEVSCIFFESRLL